jgi:threonine dehydratase
MNSSLAEKTMNKMIENRLDPKQLQRLHTSVLEAEQKIRPYIKTTRLDYSAFLSEKTSARVHLKYEHHQHTGSFKVRGAFNRLLSLTEKEAAKGIICASAGNHGCAVAYACQLLNIQAVVYLPKQTSSIKIERIESYGAIIKIVEGDCLEAERQARSEATEMGKVYISPYNDYMVMAGQGTLGIELEQQLSNLDSIFVSVGGGGLIGGMASYLKAVKPSIEIVGVWPENAPALSKCIEADQIIEVLEKPTLSESTAGGVETGSITFEPCKALIDKHILVSEEEIKKAIRLVDQKENNMIEGAAGVAVAGFLQKASHYKGKSIVILLCGQNISEPLFREITQ